MTKSLNRKMYEMVSNTKYKEAIYFFNSLKEADINESVVYLYIKSLSTIDNNKSFKFLNQWIKNNPVRTRFCVPIIENFKKSDTKKFHSIINLFAVHNLVLSDDAILAILKYTELTNTNYIPLIWILININTNTIFKSVIDEVIRVAKLFTKKAGTFVPNNDGECKDLKLKLNKIYLADPQYDELCKKIRDRLLKEGKHVKQRAKLLQKIDEMEGYDCLVDGANVGFINKGEFNFHIIANMMKKLFKLNYRPLLIVHERHLKKIPKELQSYYDKLITDENLLLTPYDTNDDLYWLYASFKFKCNVISNDQMRDHVYAMLNPLYLNRWKIDSFVRFTYDSNKLTLNNPKEYSMYIQFDMEKSLFFCPIEGTNEWIYLSF